jgi:hypothetical protein
VSSGDVNERRFWDSPRNQRFLLWGGIVLLAGGAAAALIVFLGNTASTKETFSDEPAQIFTQPKPAKVDPEARRVAGRFILTAVARKNLDQSYGLVHPDLLQGMSKAQWRKGDIPVVYFPTADLDFASFKVDHSFQNEIMLEVLLVPPAKENLQPASFYIGLKRVGGDDGPWKVFYWAPSYRPAVPDPG